ncbi:glycosyltransferase [Ornithinimicrobium avium]|nr:glycosyltransferase [Ornithinimicrobium avium]
MQSTEPARRGSAALVHLSAIEEGLDRAGLTVRRTWADPTHPLPVRLVANGIQFIRALRGADAAYLRWHVADVLPMIALRARRVPYVLEINGPVDDVIHAHPVVRPLRPLLEALARWQLRGATRITTVSTGLAGWADRQGAGHTDPQSVQNGAFPKIQRHRRPPEHPPYVVYFGELADRQGVRFLLDARRSSTWPEGLKLVVIGDGQLRPEVEAAARAGLLTSLGRLAQEGTHAIVAGAAASVSLQSPAYPRNEVMGFPFKAVESLMLGVPVVGTSLSDQDRILARFPRCGVVRYGDVPALCEALTNCVRAEEAERAAIATEAGATMTWQRAGEETAEVVWDALARSGFGIAKG